MKPPPALNRQVAAWDLDTCLSPVGIHSDPNVEKTPLSFQVILEWLEYAEKTWFRNYLPTQAANYPSEFFDRLLIWLQNDGVSTQDAPLLFEFASQLLFFSSDDFLALYRTAFTGPITRWVAQQIALRLDTPDWEANLVQQRDSRTWYCPVTDSMDIAGFYHLNQIAGVSHRPGFRSLRYFEAQSGALRAFMDQEKFDRLVLLEDFVCSGSQTAKTVRWAAEQIGKPVLFVPLIVAPDGVCRLKKIEADLGADRFQVVPIVALESSDFVGSASSENPLFSQIQALAQRLHFRVRGTTPDDPRRSPYSALGFNRPGDESTGATVALHSNCPNNTLPLVHHHSSSTHWKPLFPRVEREPAAP